MAIFTRSRLAAMAVVAVAVLAVAGFTVSRADSAPSLPPVSPDQLLGSTLAALGHPFSISGDVQTTVDLGLPELPAGLSGSASGPLTALTSLTGTQRYRVWHSSDGARVAHITDLGEQTFVTDRTQAWLWDSTTMTVQHFVAANAESAAGTTNAAAPSMGDPTVLAHRVLTSLMRYATISVDGTARVAGRPAYQLTLTPSSRLTLIGRITVAIDQGTRLPLRVQVFAKGSASPAIEAAFTGVSFDAIDPSLFAFSPPADATVTRHPIGGKETGADTPPSIPVLPATRTFGSGFATRVAVRIDQPLPAAAGALLPYAGPLGSAMTVDAGGHTWLLFGAVGLDTLRTDASSLA